MTRFWAWWWESTSYRAYPEYPEGETDPPEGPGGMLHLLVEAARRLELGHYLLLVGVKSWRRQGAGFTAGGCL